MREPKSKLKGCVCKHVCRPGTAMSNIGRLLDTMATAFERRTSKLVLEIRYRHNQMKPHTPKVDGFLPCSSSFPIQDANLIHFRDIQDIPILRHTHIWDGLKARRNAEGISSLAHCKLRCEAHLGSCRSVLHLGVIKDGGEMAQGGTPKL